MIVKRKYFSNKEEHEEKDSNLEKVANVGVPVILATGSSALLTNKLANSNFINKLADNIAWKKGTVGETSGSRAIAKLADDIARKKRVRETLILEPRGEIFQKISKHLKEGQNFLKTKKGKAIVIGTTALGTGLIAASKHRKKNKNKKKEDNKD